MRPDFYHRDGSRPGCEGNNPQNSGQRLPLLDTQLTSTGITSSSSAPTCALRNRMRSAMSSRAGVYSSRLRAISGNALADCCWLSLLSSVARVDIPSAFGRTVTTFLGMIVSAPRAADLDAGLRYEFNSPPVDTDDRANATTPSRVTGPWVRMAFPDRDEADRNNLRRVLVGLDGGDDEEPFAGGLRLLLVNRRSRP